MVESMVVMKDYYLVALKADSMVGVSVRLMADLMVD